MATTLKFLLACCALLLFDPPVARAQQCTGETETGRRLVLGYATQPTQAQRRATVPVVNPEQVRPLTNPADTEVCQRLFSVFWAQWRDPDDPRPNWAWTYYQVENLYYVIAHKTTPPVQRNPDGTFNISLSWTPLFIIDRDYQLVTTIAL